MKLLVLLLLAAATATGAVFLAVWFVRYWLEYYPVNLYTLVGCFVFSLAFWLLHDEWEKRSGR